MSVSVIWAVNERPRDPKFRRLLLRIGLLRIHISQREGRQLLRDLKRRLEP